MTPSDDLATAILHNFSLTYVVQNQLKPPKSINSYKVSLVEPPMR